VSGKRIYKEKFWELSMRILTLIAVSALVLTSACKQANAPSFDASALPQVTVPDLSEQTMKNVTKERSRRSVFHLWLFMYNVNT